MKAGKQVQQVKKRLTIRKYMHMQFLRIVASWVCWH